VTRRGRISSQIRRDKEPGVPRERPRARVMTSPGAVMTPSRPVMIRSGPLARFNGPFVCHWPTLS
jgi:hypothetical protein